MNTLLRRLAEWKGRRRAAQVIVFDGGAEVERTRSFLKGALTGITLTLIVFLLTAPTSNDAETVNQIQQRETLLRETNQRLVQAMQVADVCLNTAESLEKTLASYQAVLGNRGR